MKQSIEDGPRGREQDQRKKNPDFSNSESSNQKSKAKEKGRVQYLMIDKATKAERARPRQRKKKTQISKIQNQLMKNQE